MRSMSREKISRTKKQIGFTPGARHIPFFLWTPRILVNSNTKKRGVFDMSLVI
jgi:hypothetical protein